MSRKVDSEQQKATIAEAVWRLAARHGLESVSLREVAAEAGVSMGRVQHYFRTKDDMLLFGLRLAYDRMQSRIERRLARLAEPDAGSGDADTSEYEHVLRAMLDEMLGDSEDTRLAVRVSIAYYSRSLSDPEVAELLFGDDDELRGFAAAAVRSAQAGGRAPAELDPQREARIIWALTNDLATEVAFGRLAAPEARATVNYYLDRIISDDR